MLIDAAFSFDYRWGHFSGFEENSQEAKKVNIRLASFDHGSQPATSSAEGVHPQLSRDRTF